MLLLDLFDELIYILLFSKGGRLIFFETGFSNCSNLYLISFLTPFSFANNRFIDSLSFNKFLSSNNAGIILFISRSFSMSYISFFFDFFVGILYFLFLLKIEFLSFSGSPMSISSK